MATWLDNLFGDGEFGEPLGFAWRLQWDAASLVGLILLAAACAALIGSSRGGERRQRVAAWMGASAAVLLFLMQLRPQLELQYGDPPRIAVLLDDSSSMQQVDSQGESRFATAKQLLSSERRNLTAWRRRLQLHVFSVANEKTATIDPGDDAKAIASWAPSGAASPLEAAVNRALSAASVRPWDAVILVSDGAATGGESISEAARRCAAAGTPFFAVGCGPLKGSPNIAVASVSGDRVAYLGDVATVEAQISAAGE
ncbi:MAG: VWA domain-containing protein, partial [Planctomycetales bacterium]|nr:VWA domain-containing protein [Planctomycetales bacterium]